MTAVPPSSCTLNTTVVEPCTPKAGLKWTRLLARSAAGMIEPLVKSVPPSNKDPTEAEAGDGDRLAGCGGAVEQQRTLRRTGDDLDVLEHARRGVVRIAIAEVCRAKGVSRVYDDADGRIGGRRRVVDAGDVDLHRLG